MALPTLDATFASAADLPRRQMLAKWLVNSSFSGSIENYWTLPEHYLWAKIAVAAGAPRSEADYISLPKNYVWSDLYNAVSGSSGQTIDRGEREAIGWIAAAVRGDAGDPAKVAAYINWPWRYQVASINTYLQKEYEFVTNNVANQDAMANYVEFLKSLNVWDDINFYRDFASAKSLNHGLGPSITFTRASNATYFDSNGVMQLASEGQPRFDHDPASLESRGLLIEEQRTNLITYSSDFGNAYWSKTNITLGNNSTSPDGTTNANSILETTDNGFHVAVVTGILTVDSVYTFSVFAKANGRSKFALQVGGQQTANFDLQAVTATPLPVSGSPSASITSVGNGWFRCTATRQSTVNGNVTIILLNDSGNTQYAGNASLGMYFWGAQAELGAFATSYIPTTGSEITRNADSAVVEPISSFYNQSEGTLFGEGSQVGSSYGFIVELDANSTATRFGISTQFYKLDGTSPPSADITWSAPVVGTNYKHAYAYKASDYAGVRSGSSLQSAAYPLTASPFTHFRIGSEPSAAFLNGHIRKVAYYPKRLSNATLEALTTT